MPRPTDCIFCGKPTGSREHISLACLGGRRVHKGILCDQCNEGFSSLDAILCEQLKAINGLFAVRPDHSDTPHSAALHDPVTDQQVEISGTAPPRFTEPQILSDKTTGDRREIQARFSSQMEVQEWLKSVRKPGDKVRILPGPSGTRVFTEPLHVGWSFGGPDAFRAVARVALNFLAYQFPDLARVKALEPFKDYVLGKNPSDKIVCYDYDSPLNESSGLPAPTYALCHRIVLALDAETKEVWARVSFFSCFDLAVSFGRLCPDRTLTIVFDINPRADHLPDDMKVNVIEDRALLPFRYIPSSEKNLPKLRARTQKLMRHLVDLHWEATEGELLPEINATRGMSERARADRVMELLGRQRQRLLNLLQGCVEKWRRAMSKSVEPRLAALFDQHVMPDKSSDSGLTPSGDAMLTLVQAEIANAICEALRNREITGEELRDLLAGGRGLDLIGNMMAKSVLKVFPS